MPAPFNPYAEWLDISETAPNHYQVLGLSPTETDPDIISRAADTAINRVRSQRPGEHAAEWARLLDDLQTAKQTLTDPGRRAAYDQQLGAGSEASQTPDEPVGSPPASSAGTTEVSPSQAPAADLEMLVEGGAVDTSKYPPGFAPPGGADNTAANPMAPAQPTAQQPTAQQPATQQPAAQQPAQLTPPTVPQAASVVPADAASPARPVVDPMSPMATPVGQPVQPVAHPAQPLPAQPIAPAAPVAATPVGVPVGQAVTAPTGETATPVGPVGGKRSATREAARRRRQAWTGPLAVLMGLVILGVMAGAIYYGAFASGEPEIVDAGEPDPNGAASNPAAPSSTNPTTASGAEDGDGESDIAKGGNTPGESGDASEANSPATPNNSAPNSTSTDPDLPANTNTAEGNPSTKPKENEDNSAANAIGAIEPSEGNTAANQTASNSDDPPPPKQPTTGDGNSEIPTKPPVKPPTETTAEMTGETTDAATNPPEPPRKPTPAQIAAFRNAMLAAYDATALHRFDDARKHLDEAKSLALTEPHQKMVARLAEVSDYVRQFREALQMAIAGLAGGDVFQVGEFTVAVVERGPDYISIRVAGQNRRYKLNVLPGNTGLALADFVLDANAPSTKVIKGSYLLVHPRIDEKQMANARALWEEAKQAGADIDHLLPALEDDYAAIK